MKNLANLKQKKTQTWPSLFFYIRNIREHLVPNFLRTLKFNFCIFYQKIGVPNPEGKLAMGSFLHIIHVQIQTVEHENMTILLGTI